MVEAYLMHAKNLFGRIITPLFDEDDYNYLIYVPKKESFFGYFSDKKLKLSTHKFCDTELTNSNKKRLDNRVSKGKFIKKIDASDLVLENIIQSSQNVKDAKRKFSGALQSFSNVVEFNSK